MKKDERERDLSEGGFKNVKKRENIEVEGRRSWLYFQYFFLIYYLFILGGNEL